MKKILTLLIMALGMMTVFGGHNMASGTIYSSRAATALGKIGNKKVSIVDTGLVPRGGGTRTRERSPVNALKGTIHADAASSYVSAETRLVFAENINEG